MTDLLEKALTAARDLPAARQDEIARVILMIAQENGDEPVALSADERDAIFRSKAAAERGEFATDEQLRAIWAKHGL